MGRQGNNLIKKSYVCRNSRTLITVWGCSVVAVGLVVVVVVLVVVVGVVVGLVVGVVVRVLRMVVRVVRVLRVVGGGRGGCDVAL